MSELMKKVKESWDMRKVLYEENWEIQLLRRELEQAEAWLAAKESFLSDPSYGVSNNLQHYWTFCASQHVQILAHGSAQVWN